MANLAGYEKAPRRYKKREMTTTTTKRRQMNFEEPQDAVDKRMLDI